MEIILYVFYFFIFILIFNEFIFWSKNMYTKDYIKSHYGINIWSKKYNEQSYYTFIDLFLDIIFIIKNINTYFINILVFIINFIIFKKIFKYIFFIILLGFLWEICRILIDFLHLNNTKTYVIKHRNKFTNNLFFLFFKLGRILGFIVIYQFLNKYLKINKINILYKRTIGFVLGVPYFLINHLIDLTRLMCSILKNYNWNEKYILYRPYIFSYEIVSKYSLYLKIKWVDLNNEILKISIIFKNNKIILNPNNIFLQTECFLFKYSYILNKNIDFYKLSQILIPDGKIENCYKSHFAGSFQKPHLCLPFGNDFIMQATNTYTHSCSMYVKGTGKIENYINEKGNYINISLVNTNKIKSLNDSNLKILESYIGKVSTKSIYKNRFENLYLLNKKLKENNILVQDFVNNKEENSFLHWKDIKLKYPNIDYNLYEKEIPELFYNLDLNTQNIIDQVENENFYIESDSFNKNEIKKYINNKIIDLFKENLDFTLESFLFLKSLTD